MYRENDYLLKLLQRERLHGFLEDHREFLKEYLAILIDEMIEEKRLKNIDVLYKLKAEKGEL